MYIPFHKMLLRENFLLLAPVITQQNGPNLLQKLKTGLVMNFPTACCTTFRKLQQQPADKNHIAALFLHKERENTVIICTTTEKEEQIKENPTLLLPREKE